jgi:hypothetical protein
LNDRCGGQAIFVNADNLLGLTGGDRLLFRLLNCFLLFRSAARQPGEQQERECRHACPVNPTCVWHLSILLYL